MQGRGFEPLKAQPAGLQPAPFGHSDLRGRHCNGGGVAGRRGRSIDVRALVATAGFAVLASVSIGVGWSHDPGGGGRLAGEGAGDPGHESARGDRVAG